MTEHVNVGATDLDGEWIPTKAALRRMLADSPVDVVFLLTSEKGPRIGTIDGDASKLRGSEIPVGYALAVCGPNPFTNRRWHACVQLVDGKPRVVR